MSKPPKGREAELLKRVSDLERESAMLRADNSDLLQLTTRLGHEFNNVLQAITIKVERFAENESDEAQKLLTVILETVSRGADLAHKLLSTGPGKKTAKREPSGSMAVERGHYLATAPSSATSPQILLVEEQEQIREFTRAVLTKAGYRVAVAANGAEAIAMVRDAHFALVLMDVHMPVMNGLTATQKIRALTGPCSNVPIIAISGNVPLQHVETLMAAGMNDHIRKPFRESTLLQKVVTWLKFADLPVGQPPTCLAEETDRKIFDDACEMMGRRWIESGLTKLALQIDEVFSEGPGMPGDDGWLAGRAHALVSLAALLGFPTLSERCSALEEASRNGDDVRLPFEQAKASALQARKDAYALLADRRSGSAVAEARPVSLA